jgi:hypothetical protein
MLTKLPLIGTIDDDFFIYKIGGRDSLEVIKPKL